MEVLQEQLADVVAGFRPFHAAKSKLQSKWRYWFGSPDPVPWKKPLWAEAFDANGMSYPKEWLHNPPWPRPERGPLE